MEMVVVETLWQLHIYYCHKLLVFAVCLNLALAPASLLKNGGKREPGNIAFAVKAVDFQCVIIYLINEGPSHFGSKCCVTY